jgi:hypothetical protein
MRAAKTYVTSGVLSLSPLRGVALLIGGVADILDRYGLQGQRATIAQTESGHHLGVEWVEARSARNKVPRQPIRRVFPPRSSPCPHCMYQAPSAIVYPRPHAWSSSSVMEISSMQMV